MWFTLACTLSYIRVVKGWPNRKRCIYCIFMLYKMFGLAFLSIPFTHEQVGQILLLATHKKCLLIYSRTTLTSIDIKEKRLFFFYNNMILSVLIWQIIIGTTLQIFWYSSTMHINCTFLTIHIYVYRESERIRWVLSNDHSLARIVGPKWGLFSSNVKYWNTYKYLDYVIDNLTFSRQMWIICH